MSSSTTFCGSALVLGVCLALTGCARAPSEAPAAAPMPVTVSYPVERDVTDYADFTGRTAAVDSVEVRARVWGYLDKVNFKEGALVKKGDVLFEIDPRPYRAELEPSRGNVAQYEARVHRLERDYQRRQGPDSGVQRSARKNMTGTRAITGRRRPTSMSPRPTATSPRWTWSTRRSQRRSAGASADTSSRWAT